MVAYSTRFGYSIIIWQADLNSKVNPVNNLVWVTELDIAMPAMAVADLARGLQVSMKE